MTRINQLECLLFVAGEPVPARELARALKCDESEVLVDTHALKHELDARQSPLQVLEIAGGWQLSTRPEYADTIAALLARGSNKLSRAALETLAIIAYRQPVTQTEMEAVRGVSVSGVVKTLADRKLISEAGRKQVIGRPILYVTTQEFLHYFNMKDISELPPIDDAESEVRLPNLQMPLPMEGAEANADNESTQ